MSEDIRCKYMCRCIPLKNNLKYGPTKPSLLTKERAHMASSQTIWIFSLRLGKGVTQISFLTRLS